MQTTRLLWVFPALVLALAVMPAFGQGNAGSLNLSMTFTSPTAFYVQNTKLPAGAYNVTQLGQPGVLVVRSVRPGHEVLAEVSQLPSPNEKPKSAQVVFSKYGDNDFLSQIWFVSPSSAIGYQVGATAAEKSQSGTASKHTVVGAIKGAVTAVK